MLKSVLATTLNKYGRKLYGQIWSSVVLYLWLMEHDRVSAVDGGINIVEDVEISMNDSVDWRNPKSQIPLTEQDPFRQVAWPWATLDGGLPIYGYDERRNRGESRIVDYSQSLINNFTRTMKYKVGCACYSNGTDPLMMQGLDAICSDSNIYPLPNPEQQVPGIDRSKPENAYWRANVFDTTEAWTLDGKTESWDNAYLKACKGDPQDQPDLILCTGAIFNWYNALLLKNERYEDPKLAEAGFRNLMYKNTVVVWDGHCPGPSNSDIHSEYASLAGESTYILNTKYIKLRPDSLCAKKFITKGRHEMENVDADRILQIWEGQMTCTMPNKQVKIANKTAPTS
ncbi:MAG: phage major capsid protein [Armatimonadota bacterium]